MKNNIETALDKEIQEKVISLCIYDAMCNWLSKNDKQFIPPRAFLEISKSASKEIIKNYPDGK